jgi:hypothetical protein
MDPITTSAAAALAVRFEVIALFQKLRSDEVMPCRFQVNAFPFGLRQLRKHDWICFFACNARRGLGLSLVKQITENHGGKVGIESGPSGIKLSIQL